MSPRAQLVVLNLHITCIALCSGLPLSFLSWAYVRQGVYFGAYGTPGVSIFGVFRTPSLPIFGVIFGLLEASKMYK